MRIVASPLALEVLVALSQRRDGARLAELATCVAARLSSAQRALRLLRADGLVIPVGRARPRYRIQARHAAVGPLLEVAFASAARERALRAALRGNPSVELVAADERGYVVIEGALADPRDLLLLEGAIARYARGGGETAVLRVPHRELVGRAPHRVALRSRIARARIVKGARSSQLPRASARALAEVARRYALRRIRLFGSAARGEQRATSDIDVVVEPRAGAALSFVDLARLEADLERLYGRHVDLVTAAGLREPVRAAAERDAVAVYGRT